MRDINIDNFRGKWVDIYLSNDSVIRETRGGNTTSTLYGVKISNFLKDSGNLEFYTSSNYLGLVDLHSVCCIIIRSDQDFFTLESINHYKSNTEYKI